MISVDRPASAITCRTASEKKILMKLGVVANTCDSSIQDAKAG